MDLTITDNPAVKLQQVAWIIIDHNHQPVRLMLPNRSRYWSYFTKAAARLLAEHTHGHPEVTRTHSMKEVVTEIPPGLVESLITRQQGATKIETSITVTVKQEGQGMFVSLNTEGDYADEALNHTFYAFPELPPPDITPSGFWGGLMMPLAHTLATREEG